MAMNRLFLRATCLFFLIVSGVIAQSVNVVVERYYVSDMNDATDTIGGAIAPGTVTYRIFVEMGAGCRLKRLYGDDGHPLEFRSTAPFFNHRTDGQSFGKDFNKTRFGEGTVALDSWLTLGQVTRNAPRTWFGVLKRSDSDGSFVGGSNNDGGSAALPQGLLNNNDTTAGIPLTVADGNDTMATLPVNWYSDGIVDPISGNDSTIFGSLVTSDHFVSTSAFLANNGVMGKGDTTNRVLIAQLTTAGVLEFKVNVLVDVPTGGIFREVKYVAQLAPGETNSDTVKSAPTLNYPPVCGCLDPHYIEYSPDYACGVQDSCHNLVVFGCTDTAACNYDPAANYHLPSLCCYPGYCNDRDLAVVCPQLNLGRNGFEQLTVLPNPVEHELILQWLSPVDGLVSLEVFTLTGQSIGRYQFIAEQSAGRVSVDARAFATGVYVLRVSHNGEVINRLFIKN